MKVLSKPEFAALVSQHYGVDADEARLFNDWLKDGCMLVVYQNNDLSSPNVGTMEVRGYPKRPSTYRHDDWRFNIVGTYCGEPVETVDLVTAPEVAQLLFQHFGADDAFRVVGNQHRLFVEFFLGDVTVTFTMDAFLPKKFNRLGVVSFSCIKGHIKFSGDRDGLGAAIVDAWNAALRMRNAEGNSRSK